MLARAGAITLAQRRYSRRNVLHHSILYGSAGCVAFLGGIATLNESRCDQGLQYANNEMQSSNMSIIIPTMEAGIRAARLVRTAILMIMDYEIAKLKPMILGDKENIEHLRLEREMEMRENELEKAQLAYAGDEDDGDNISLMSPDERRELKLRQKKQMEFSAQLLAEAEKQLETMEGGSSKSKAHRKAATRLLNLCRQNGGVYIKVGQHLANLDYLIPQEYIDALSSLFDSAPQSDYEQVCKVIQEDLNTDVDKLYDNFDPVPLASASLGQVHVAYDKVSGRKLAVKVQHYGLRETSAGDIFTVSTVVRFIDSIFEDFTFGWIADEIAPHLPKELDFVREGKNAERAAKHIAKTGLDCIVPKIIWEKTSPRVLTMEFEEGFKATDVDAIEASGLNKHDIAKLVSSVFNAQMFLSGFIHCDPHPANVLLRENKGKPQMVLVDHGLYKDIDDDFRIRYAKLWKSLMLADLKGIETSCKGLGIGKAYPLFAAMLTARPYDEIIERSKTRSFSAPCVSPESQADKAVIRGYAKQFLTDIFVLLGVLPRQMLLLLKMNDCLRHIDYALGSPANTLVVAGTYASKAVYEEEAKSKQRSVRSRIQSWLGYIQLYLRIQVFDLGTWLVRQVPSATLKAS